MTDPDVERPEEMTAEAQSADSGAPTETHPDSDLAETDARSTPAPDSPELTAQAPAAEADQAPPEAAEAQPSAPLTPGAEPTAEALEPQAEALAAAPDQPPAEPPDIDEAAPSQAFALPGLAGSTTADDLEAVAHSAAEALAQEAQAAAPQPMPEPAPAADQPEAAPAEEPDDGRKWYVVHCYSGYENKVRHNLEQRIDTMGMKDKIFDVVVPTEEEIEVKDGKRRTVERRVFPGYILVQMILSEDSWYVVRNTPGVTGFVGMGNEPTPLRPEEVASIVRRMEAEAPRVKVTYKAGQRVRINDGPFNDFIGTVAEIDMERAKVRVMVSFFGRETPVELDFLQVEKA